MRHNVEETWDKQERWGKWPNKCRETCRRAWPEVSVKLHSCQPQWKKAGEATRSNRQLLFQTSINLLTLNYKRTDYEEKVTATLELLDGIRRATRWAVSRCNLDGKPCWKNWAGTKKKKRKKKEANILLSRLNQSCEQTVSPLHTTSFQAEDWLYVLGSSIWSAASLLLYSAESSRIRTPRPGKALTKLNLYKHSISTWKLRQKRGWSLGKKKHGMRCAGECNACQ